MFRTSALLFLVSGSLIACGDDFDPPKLSFAITANGNGGGTVTSTPAGIDCGTTCSYAFAPGTKVVLTATPDAGSSFVGWSGSCTGTEPCAITIGSTGSVTANFAKDNALTVTVTGAGRVTSSPGGIDCGDDCSKIFTSGTKVTLTATPDTSTNFAGWSGACTGTEACVVSLDKARDVTATFELKHHVLSVVRTGNGTGAVSSLPAGIACGADCDETYEHGTSVTLTAVADVGSTFVGWSGGDCNGSASVAVPVTCIVSVEDATEVTAAFSLNTYGVTVVKAGNGAGLVTSAGIDCGLDCGESYDHGTEITLTAAPSTGSTFDGWSGPCTGSGTCVITVSEAAAVTATFTLTQHVLTVARDGNGTGTVTSTPSGIECGTDCDETLDYGTSVTLTAAPAANATFEGWTGGNCSGTGTCVVELTAATTVTATFALVQHTLTVTTSGFGSVTSSPSGITCGTDCDEAYDDGTVVTLTATPASGQAFTGWSGGCTGTGACVITLTAAATVEATFSTCPSGTRTFSYTGAAQAFTVPACVTSITVDAYGAQGGTSTGEEGGMTFIGGLGAHARGTFAVTGDETIDIIVGGRGTDSNCGSGGGGGSFATSSGVLLVAAAGGGGGFHCSVLGGANGAGGNVGTSGGDGVCAVNPYGRAPTAGGTNGNGASCGFGGGGGGFLSNGSSQYGPTSGGNVFGAAATPGGGFGGGGGYYESCCGGSGGGGGYSGGGGSQVDGCAGGGGGSYNGGTAQFMAAATNAGNGTVVISY